LGLPAVLPLLIRRSVASRVPLAAVAPAAVGLVVAAVGLVVVAPVFAAVRRAVVPVRAVAPVVTVVSIGRVVASVVARVVAGVSLVLDATEGDGAVPGGVAANAVPARFLVETGDDREGLIVM